MRSRVGATREMDHDRRHSVSPYAPAALAAVVIGSVLAVGTVHTSVLLVVALAAVAATAWVLWSHRRGGPELPSPALVLLGLAAWSAAQAIPLPTKLLGAIAPHNADIWVRALKPLEVAAPRLASISLDPGASAVEALKWVTYAAVFTLAYTVGRRNGRNWGPLLVFAAAVVVSLVTVIHGVIGAKAYFGVYVPRAAVPRWGIAPLLNPNNLSGYLNLGALCGMGFLLTHRSSRAERPLPPDGWVFAGIAVVVAVSLLAASRGGVLGLGLGAIALAVAVRVFRGNQAKAVGGRRRAAGIALAVAGGALLAILGASEATWQELGDTSAEKLRLLGWSKPLLSDHLWLGVGRGAFETVFPAYNSRGGRVLYSHPENFVVQWVAEWGLLVAALALALFVWHFRPARLRLSTNRAAVAAIVGVLVVLLQNLADLALEVPAVMIALSAALGSLWTPARAAAPSNATDPSSRLRRRLPAVAVAGTGAVAVLAVVLGPTHSAASERTELGAALNAKPISDPDSLHAFHRRLAQAMRRHPADPHFPLLGAIAARRVRGADALPWVARALERDPTNARAHFVLAEILAARGAKLQAFMEMRIALEADKDLVGHAAQLAVRWSREPEELDRAAPEGNIGAQFFYWCGKFVPASDFELRSQLFDAALDKQRDFAPAVVAKGFDRLDRAEVGAAPCTESQRADCLTLVEGLAETAARVDPRSCDAPILKGRALVLRGRAQDAERGLAVACATCRGPLPCLAARLRAAAAAVPATELGAAIRAYTGTACSQAETCADAHSLVGDVLSGRQEWAAAADHYATAAQRVSTVGLWLKLADAASRAGQATRAMTAIEKAQRAGVGDPGLARRVEEQRKQLFLRAMELPTP